MNKPVEFHTQAPEVDLAGVRERVLAEAARFRGKLPSLLLLYGEKWVVFRDGDVVSAHATDEEAYLAGLERFGPHGGQVIALVREAEVIFLSGAASLGL